MHISTARPARAPSVANFLTLHGLWYSLNFGEIVRDEGTGDTVIARKVHFRN
jgi:hypothetical protein